MKPIRILGPADLKRYSSDPTKFIINVTSGSKTWSKVFSPFFLGPVKLYGPYGAWNVENAWQFSKLYECHSDDDGNPTDRYWEWAEKGWGDKLAHRYPMGKGAIPQCSLWDGEKLGYLDARRKIYIPLYERAVHDSGYLDSLILLCQDLWQDGLEVCFFDFDGYDHLKKGLTYQQCLDSTRRLGHAFVLANMIQGELMGR